jgi:DNA-binding XRE family transcriptional regulator
MRSGVTGTRFPGEVQAAAARASTMERMPRARVPDEDAVRFGAIVTRLRMERGWTLADFSRVSGMNATWLGVLERGGNTPSLTTIFKLAAVFGIEAAALVRAVDEARRVPLEPVRAD